MILNLNTKRTALIYDNEDNVSELSKFEGSNPIQSQKEDIENKIH